jgi:hypothetical protein
MTSFAGLALAALLAQSALDFELYRSRIEPIFLAKRTGHARCYVCHSRGTYPFRLQRLAPGSASWSEEQSRLNFAEASRLIVPGVPLESRLLTMPLSEEAGGNPFHPGGKHWGSQDDPEWKTLAGWVGSSARAASLDFRTFRTRIEPLFLKKREGHARCVVCHTRATTPFRLQLLADGSSSWTEEQSRLNFAEVSRLVVPGEPLGSRLLVMPLSHEAGGTAFHPGGKHWESQSDPEWQELADWVHAVK